MSGMTTMSDPAAARARELAARLRRTDGALAGVVAGTWDVLDGADLASIGAARDELRAVAAELDRPEPTPEPPADLARDAKLVYNGSLNDLLRLARAYGVTTNRMRMIDEGTLDVSGYAGAGIAAFPTSSDQREARTLVYAAIKRRMR